MRPVGAISWLALGAAALLACSDRGRQDDRKQARGPQETSASARAGPQGTGSAQANGQDGQQETSRARQEQRPEAQAQASAGSQSASESTVSGRVVRASKDELVLRRGGGEPDLRLSVGPDVPVLRGGDRASLTELREGTEVRASYSVEDGGKPVATRVEVGEAK